MPLKRRNPKRQTPRISDEAVEAYKARDYRRLHLALKLPPWHASPLEIDDDPAPRYMAGTVQEVTWPAAQELQRELERLSR